MLFAPAELNPYDWWLIVSERHWLQLFTYFAYETIKDPLNLKWIRIIDRAIELYGDIEPDQEEL